MVLQHRTNHIMDIPIQNKTKLISVAVKISIFLHAEKNWAKNIKNTFVSHQTVARNSKEATSILSSLYRQSELMSKLRQTARKLM